MDHLQLSPMLSALRRNRVAACLALCAALAVAGVLAVPARADMAKSSASGPFAAAPMATVAPTAAPAPTAVPVGGRIQADNACYVRLPDLPKALFGMFGAYNPNTGVLVSAGGAERIDENNIISYYQMQALQLNSREAKWQSVPYPSTVGYTHENDKGCREMISVQEDASTWLSVLGKDGCDRGRFDTAARKGGDIQALHVGATADAYGVNWVPHSGMYTLVDNLTSRKAVLAAHFATWDYHRGRLIFGQGSFNSKRETEAQDEVYVGDPVGEVIRVQQMNPTGPIPERRWGSCGAYIYDAEAGLDGVMVLGGKEGAPYNIPSRLFKEVWWLDFTKSPEGVWSNVTAKFANMNNIGPRWDSACVYDPQTHFFYDWMGQADAKIPDGAGYSSGMWRVNVSALADPAASLTWERLAKDNLKGIKGRRAFASTWDSRQKRFFVIGGRAGLIENKDVWAIYPDVTGDACQTLDPSAMPPDVPTPAPAPTATAVPAGPQVCPQITNQVPPAILAAALANPATIYGYNQPMDPAKPASPSNPPRTWLTMLDPSKPFHPLFNGLLYRAGCP